MTDEAGWAPDACTLPTAQRPLRRAEFDDVFALSTDVSRISEGHARFGLTGDDELAEQLRDLAARESECCSFFTFAVTVPAPDRVEFEIDVPAGHVDVLDALIARAESVRAAH